MDLAELARLLENLLRLGTVAAVQTGNPPRVRVQTGGLTTTWLPWAERRAGKTRTWNPPTVGEQVLLLCPSGDVANGIVLTGIPSDATDVPSHSANETVTSYPDGALTRYDHATSELAITGVKTILVEAATSVLVRCPDTTFDGNVTVQGLLSYQNGIAGTGGEHGNAITGDFIHRDGVLSSNDVVLDKHDHGGVYRGDSRTDGPR
ncbi:phage baseplate assembly protein V [Cupriavidus basilensis]|uniref:phage baseplate assembly protein V n=1 Tax=Cupriavidus basilensis TaxID=68895 RepID=UPI0005B7BA8C|nr:phage baseplate assembly protein V [Cupriavidus basilensis]